MKRQLFQKTERVLSNHVYLFSITTVSVFLAYAIVNFILSILPTFPVRGKYFVEASLITTITFPALYFLIFRPLRSCIAEHNMTVELLTNSEEKYRSLVESTEDSIYVIDRNHKYLYMNKKHISELGLSENQIESALYSDFHSQEETKEFIEKTDKVFETGESVQHRFASQKSGKHFIQTLSPIKRSDGIIIGLTVVSKDITELKSIEEKLYALSLTDELTGIYNRRGFFTLGEQQLKLSRRMKTGIYLLYADVDKLKDINDTFGHKEGDSVLIDAANILKKTFRESDIIARISGDEFVVIPIGANGNHIDLIISRLQKSIDLYNEERKRHYNLSMSVGMAYYNPERHCSLDALLEQADKLMYERKRERKGTLSNNGPCIVRAVG
ncbi:MAG: sensor domain-containing diguanylate cyclase [Thermodesulfovibrionales bacterium]|nr:sensor domain-containing diguanylate cyclase [Thermodesulfovibrionales bacterium]